MQSGSLFSTSAESPARFVPLCRLAGLIVDDIFEDPLSVREAALRLPYTPASDLYPGRVAAPPERDSSLDAFLDAVLDLVNGQFLPRVPIVRNDGRRVRRFSSVTTDVASVDLHPEELRPHQGQPHVDPVPVFGLVYLSPSERGGTLFFESTGGETAGAPTGYSTASEPGFELCGRIEGKFNRLAIYPGSIPHTGEIAGDWIRSEERLTDPRLTMRIMFFE